MERSENILDILEWPFDGELLLRKQRSLRRHLLARDSAGFVEKRIAILGGSTTGVFKDMLELFLLASGVRSVFYESEYNKWYEDGAFPNEELKAFAPKVIFIFTSIANLDSIRFAAFGDTPEQTAKQAEQEYIRYETIWSNLAENYSAIIIQNNFDPPPYRPEGSLDAVIPQSLIVAQMELNRRFSAYARGHKGFYLHDIAYLAADIGLKRWHDRTQYHAYKFAMRQEVMPEIAWSAAKVILSALGRAKKCLVLDLDNTLWGGVIGDDGVGGIALGHETAVGEAYLEFQQYVKHLQERGILLAICSKNEEDNAKEGFLHPDSVLRFEDFTAARINWKPKDQNIRELAREINIGLDSLVFLDDNPVERALVRESVPEVAVPEVDPTDVSSFIRAIEGHGYFESVNISSDDIARVQTYRENRQREELAEQAASYEDFLRSLHMEAEIAPFTEIYFDRITQLTNKTNQFNLTTRRCTLAEIQRFAEDETYITRYCRLKDKFGDNGLISLVVGERREDEIHIILWLMSCRVLKRDVESLMLDEMVRAAQSVGAHKLVGYYYPTAKNKMVADMYLNFGFTQKEDSGDDSIWELDVDGYKPKNHLIAVSYDRQ